MPFATHRQFIERRAKVQVTSYPRQARDARILGPSLPIAANLDAPRSWKNKPDRATG
jgi:hypothetical protein